MLSARPFSQNANAWHCQKERATIYVRLDAEGNKWQKNAVNVENIRKRLHEDFSPFIIRLTGGRKFPIPHQDFIALGKHAVVVIDDEGYAVKIDPLHIVSLDDVKAKSSKR